MKTLSNLFFALLIGLFCVGTSVAQTSKADKKAAKSAELKRIIDGKNYAFKANFAQPLSTINAQIGGMSTPLNTSNIPLTSSYDVTLSHDTLSAYLPYYGVAYTAPVDSREGGVKFTTTKFDYKVTGKKNGTVQLSFKPLELNQRPPSDVQSMTLTVSESGFANLQITLLNRQSISYTGTLEEIKPKKAS